jgi:hypothetical protein
MRKSRLLGVLALLLLAARAPAQTSFVNGVTSHGESIQCDLPLGQQIKNIGSRRDGAGMCVMSSIEMAARYQNLTPLIGLRDWAAQYPGGAYPEKVDRQLAAFFKARNLAPVPYLQYEGSDPDRLLTLIDRTNRMACIAYGQSPRYAGPRNPRGIISHMVDCVLYGEKYGVVLDNNFIGDSSYEWMPKSELVRRMKMTSGSAWVFVWLTPGSPPPPRAKTK